MFCFPVVLKFTIKELRLIFFSGLFQKTFWKPYLCSSFEGHPLQVRHKQDWDREFILLLPQTAVLPESDAVSSVIKPALSFSSKTVRPRAPCGARCIGHAVRIWSTV